MTKTMQMLLGVLMYELSRLEGTRTSALGVEARRVLLETCIILRNRVFLVGGDGTSLCVWQSGGETESRISYNGNTLN